MQFFLIHLLSLLLLLWLLLLTTAGQPTPAMGSKLSSAGGQLTYTNLEVVVRRLTLAGAAHLLLKAVPSFFLLLGVTEPSVLYPYLSPRIADALVTNTCTGTEMLCGEKLCSMRGKVHLAWSLPMMGAGALLLANNQLITWSWILLSNQWLGQHPTFSRESCSAITAVAR